LPRHDRDLARRARRQPDERLLLAQARAARHEAAWPRRHHQQRAVALEEARSGVRINTIAPAGVETPLYLATFGAAEQSDQAFTAAHPVGRLAQPQEIASLVLYLASDDAAFFHGATLAMDGGWSAQ
jgi:enoyl-[acyl-carrier-protein] reductase (NADH)